MDVTLKPLVACVVVAVALVAGGCSSTIVTPTAQVTSIALADQSTEGARIQVTVELGSNNSVPLPLVRCDYSVALEGVGTFSFVELPNKAIPAKRTDIKGGPATQVITLIAAFGSAADMRGRNCRVAGTVTYEPPGEMRKIMTESAVPLPSVPFSGSARLE